MFKIIRRIMEKASIGAAMLFLMAQTAFADEAPETIVAEKINSGLDKIYDVIIMITLPIAALSIAIAAIHFFGGTEKSVEKAKKTIILAAGGIGIIFLAPAMVVKAKELFYGNEIVGPQPFLGDAGYVNNSIIFYSLIGKDIPEMGIGIQKILSIFEAILLPSACLSIIYGGLCFFGMDFLSGLEGEKQVARGKRIIVVSLTAVAAFYMLPFVVSLAAQTFDGGSAWAPPVPQ